MPEIRMIEIKHLTLLKNNPRKIDKAQFKKLCDSLEEDPEFFGNRPCLVNVVDGVHHVYAGNQRVQAAKKLGWKLVPCIVEEDVPEDRIKSRIIKDNVSMGTFDWEELGNSYEIDELLLCGLTEKELHLDLSLDDDEPEAPSKEKEAQKCPHCGLDI